uniref:Thiol:disulfide interchange protein DsbA n=1 Tax=uncultured Acidobacteriota bacterium TaxID=171953 RepID=H5SDA7_9BACT|nr:thiol:disulfide interchange protein DsbA [uncultured Acidobacteriota bacterium]
MDSLRSKRMASALIAAWLLPLLQAGPPQQASPPSNPELQALRREIEALREGQARIEKQLQEIRDLLSTILVPRPTAPREIALTVDGAPAKGEKTARVILIEFSDYQCPFCARHARETLPQIEREYIRTGKVRYVVRDFPLPTHRQAFKAAEAAHCAAEQGRFWEMYARLFEHQHALDVEALPQHAQALGLDLPRFQQCLQEGRYAEAVRRDLEDGRRAGVRGTPTFFLGTLEPDGARVKVQRVIVGAQPYAAFREALEGLLAAQKP